MSHWRRRVVYAKKGDLRFISHLDLVRLWQRALRRARVPVAYSQGYNPQPRLAFAAALPVGHVGWRERFDAWLEEDWPPARLMEALAGELPADVDLVSAEVVPLRAPSLQSQVVAARYRVAVPYEGPLEEVARRVEDLLAREEVPWERVRRGRGETFNLRPWLLGLRVESCGGGECSLWMHLQAGQRGTLRPEDVVGVLGMPGPGRLERLALDLAGEGENHK